MDSKLPGREGHGKDAQHLSYASELNVTSILGRNATLTCSYNASTGDSVSKRNCFNFSFVVILPNDNLS